MLLVRSPYYSFARNTTAHIEEKLIFIFNPTQKTERPTAHKKANTLFGSSPTLSSPHLNSDVFLGSIFYYSDFTMCIAYVA